MAPVPHHGNPEGRVCRSLFGMYTRLTGQGLPRPARSVQPDRQLRPVRGGQRDLARRSPPSCGQRCARVDPPHADQRVRPAPQHQLLQVADPFRSPVLRRREDPLPQPPYVVLDRRQSIGVPVQGSSSGPFTTGRRRHRERLPVIVSNLPFGSGASTIVVKGSPGPRQRPFGPGHQARYPASYPGRPAEEPATSSRFPAAFRPPAFASWASCSRPGLGLPHGRLTGRQHWRPDPDGVSTFHTRETRPGWVPPLPRDGGALPAGRTSRPAPAASQRPVPAPRHCIPSTGARRNETSTGVHSRSPVRSSPHL